MIYPSHSNSSHQNGNIKRDLPLNQSIQLLQISKGVIQPTYTFYNIASF